MTDGNGYQIWIPAALGATVARCITHPLDVVRVLLQASPSSTSYQNLLSSYYKSNGINGYYRGFTISLMTSAPASSIYLTTYTVVSERLKSSSSQTKSGTAVGVAAVAAELVSGLFWTPAETVKARLAVERTNKINSYRMIQRIIQQEGLRGLFRGYTLGLLVFIPQSVTYFWIYEYLKHTFDLNNKDVPLWKLLSISLPAATVAACISNPLDVIKTNWQVIGRDPLPARPKTILEMCEKMIQKDGWRLLTKGMAARVFWLSPSIALSMAFYEKLLILFN